MAEQELNLLKFTPAVVTQFSARSAKIVGGHTVKTQSQAVVSDDAPNEILADAVTPNASSLTDRPKQPAASDSRR